MQVTLRLKVGGQSELIGLAEKLMGQRDDGWITEFAFTRSRRGFVGQIGYDLISGQPQDVARFAAKIIGNGVEHDES